MKTLVKQNVRFVDKALAELLHDKPYGTLLSEDEISALAPKAKVEYEAYEMGVYAPKVMK